MGEIIFKGNFMVSGQFSGGQFSSWTIILGGNCPGGNHPGGNYPGGNFPLEKLSGHLQQLGCL